MATRFYLPRNGAAPVTVAADAAWQDAASVIERPALTAKSATSGAVITAGGGGAGAQNVLCGRFVSGVIKAQTITGTVKGQVMCLENDGAINARSQLVIRVVSEDGLTIRGVLVAAHAAALSSEWAAGLRNRKAPLAALSPFAVTPVVTQSGDRIVVEIGALAGDNGIDTIEMSFSDNQGADLPEDETSGIAAGDPWIEFSQTVQLGYGSVLSGGGGGVGVGVGCGIGS